MSTNMNVNGATTPSKVVSAVRQLVASNPKAMSFFEMNAKRLRDAAVTNLDVVARKLEISRPEVVQFAKELAATGSCNYIIGRRGLKSRLEWNYSCVALGQAALGETVKLEPPAPGPGTAHTREGLIAAGDDFETKADTTSSPQEKSSLDPPKGNVRHIPSREEMAESFQATKESLSRVLGIPVSNIEVSIRV